MVKRKKTRRGDDNESIKYLPLHRKTEKLLIESNRLKAIEY